MYQIKKNFRIPSAMTIAVLAALSVPIAGADRQDALTTDYREPSAAVVDLLTATPPPQPLVHPNSRRVALLFREPVIELERLTRPRLGLAGFRLDPDARVSGVNPLIARIEVHGVAGTMERAREWRPEGGAVLDYVHFSPDGRMLSAVAVSDGPARLVLFDIERGRERALGSDIDAAWGDPCSWAGNDALVCRVVPKGRGEPPQVSAAPLIVEHEGGAAPGRTYAYLLKNALDDALFEHYFTVDVARVGIDGGERRVPGLRGLIEKLEPSPDGAYAVISRIERPYSRLLPARHFPSVVELWDLDRGAMLYESRAAGDDEADRERPRRSEWKSGMPVTLGFIRSSKGEDGKRLHRWMELAAPFDAAPREVVASDASIKQFGWTTAGTPYFTTADTETGGVRLYTVTADGPSLVWTGSTTNAYDNPGRALRVDAADGPVLESDSTIFLAGDGQGPGGPQPFLDAFDFETAQARRIFLAEPGVFEQVLAMLDPKGPVFVTSRETETDAPQLFLHDGSVQTAIGTREDPYPQLANTTRQLLNFTRADGVALSGTLYLPAGHREGERLPTLVWIYPHEFSDVEQAEQLDLRAFRYHQVKGPSPLAAVVAGYAVLMNPTVPILYEDSAVNDNYLAQLVSSLDAAVKHLVALGVTDPARVAVGGRSYGAFSSANLLIHSDLFATAVAMSGAYNRTLTPFGFQHEKRSFWDAMELYADISPFYHADELTKPLLLVHGGGDENPGTPPLQARRFFHALVGQGAQVRYVELPLEGHHYWARENVLLAAAEMIDWLDKTIGVERAAVASNVATPDH